MQTFATCVIFWNENGKNISSIHPENLFVLPQNSLIHPAIPTSTPKLPLSNPLTSPLPPSKFS